MMNDPRTTQSGHLQASHLLFGTFRRELEGFRTVCASPGLTDGQRAAAERSCREWGACVEPGFRTALIHKPVTVTDPDLGEQVYYLVIRVTNIGFDRALRRGATCFHVVFFDEDGYARVGFEPFALGGSGLLVGDWDGQKSWPPLDLALGELPAPVVPDPLPVELDVLREQLLHLLAGREVSFAGALPSPASDSYVELLFRLLPWPWRRGSSMATFTFGRHGAYDLAMEYDSADRFEPWKPRPNPSLPRDLAPGVLAYAEEVLNALRLRDSERIFSLARSAQQFSVLHSSGPEVRGRSWMGRFLGRRREGP